MPSQVSLSLSLSLFTEFAAVLLTSDQQKRFAFVCRLNGLKIRVKFAQYSGQPARDHESERIASELFGDLQNMSSAAEALKGSMGDEYVPAAIELLICVCLCCEIW